MRSSWFLLIRGKVWGQRPHPFSERMPLPIFGKDKNDTRAIIAKAAAKEDYERWII